MDKRILWGCVAAVGLLTLFAVATYALGAGSLRTTMTPLGELPLLDLLGVLVAMTVGGAIAGPRFRRIAVALMATVWVLSLSAMVAAPHVSVPGALKYNALAIVSTLLLAWVGAVAGPKLLARWRSQRAGVAGA